MACSPLHAKTSRGCNSCARPWFTERRNIFVISRTRYSFRAAQRGPVCAKVSYRGYLGDTRFRKEPRYSKAAIDQNKEENRRHMRTVFDFERWASHRSSQRYLQHITGIPRSRIIRGLRVPLICVFIFATCVATWESYKEAHPSSWLPSSSLEATDPFNLTNFALALLLAFRLDASYSRFMEGRSIWGNIVSDSRNLIRQAQAYVDDEHSLQLLLRWTSAFSRALMWHVREECDLEAEMQGVLLPHEIQLLMNHEHHKPNFVLAVLTQVVDNLPTSEAHKLAMDASLTSFHQAVGACERMIKTPIPRSYTRHTSRFLVIWLAFLPFTLWRACHWVMVPATVLIAFLLLGVEEIGVQIEEPFGILPLENLVDIIHYNSKETVDTRHTVAEIAGQPPQPVSNSKIRHGNGTYC
ncbi:hypothetical protein ABBQ32_004262 [Trebouxia sp. C0010 RCD-2024]